MTGTSGEHVAAAGHWFLKADQPDQDPIVCAVEGLRRLMMSIEAHTDDVSPRLAACADEAMKRAAATIIAAAHPHLDMDETALKLGAASGLLRLFGKDPAELWATETPEIAADRFDLAALLADELDALHRRRMIESRGDVFRRHSAIAMAQIFLPPSGGLLH